MGARSTRGKEATATTTATAPVKPPENHITKPKVKKPPARKDCSTCGRTLSPGSFPKAATSNCKHKATACKACLKKWITAQLDTVTYDNLACPECPQLMTNSDIKTNATKQTYERFEELERRGIADNTPGWRWCLNPQCRAGQVHVAPVSMTPKDNSKSTKSAWKFWASAEDKPEPNICKCNECGAKACVPCERIHPESETCAEWQKRLKGFAAEEKATLKTIATNCKQCPNCSKNIQRNGGCDHMSCTQCKTAFCWLCLRTYRDIHTEGHGKGCAYAKPGAIDPHAPNAMMQ